jgi:hypothetical protein|tara:strand:+ start:3538 stop:3708 length:171 start_codon:yes stop_codon:yes gene_type:complete
MHEQGMSKVSGAVAERKAIAEKIDELQIDLHNGKIDFEDFFHLIALLKDELQNGII